MNCSQDPCYQELKEVIRDYEEFLSFSGCVDHFYVYKCLKKNLKDNQEFCNSIFSQVRTFAYFTLDMHLSYCCDLLKVSLTGICT